ncbi:MAG: hypothetical protein HOM34_09585 [Planctomycetes bacterium]|jgi:agmatine/peptidylarginine deiminase|nr:hypothetical protein [Planctomycetota bacterium]MBT4029034.1 hypothetical protein [Planctomycetota bacterium]MBT4560346.1 hypothetical protein [Planctomycetota bacterium]MBT5120959.1 hypothetical protein [Planctomycetota bacterium]MBT7012056.1 hypothetical protein [Planctomycetota bacterium]
MLSLLPSILLLAAAAQEPQPVYPEGADISRALTKAETQWLKTHDLVRPAAATPPAEGPVFCVPEYAPMDGILIAWEGTNGQKTILAQMAAAVTTMADAKVYCVVDSASEISAATNSIQGQGADMNLVEFPITKTDTIWIRDYGPRYIYQNGVRAIVDHDYNRPRNNDNAFPDFFSRYRHRAYYNHDLTHGGGNFHLDALGGGYLTRLITNENNGMGEAYIHGVFDAYQNLDCTFFAPFPSSVDSTQHLDMWMIVVDDDKVIISEWPTQGSSTQAQICDAAAATMAAKGFQVFRMPAKSTSGWNGVHYTYTNAVMCNDIVMVPQFSNSAISQYNSTALQVWQAACPSKTIVPINSDALVTSAGVMHCVMMHVPAASDGDNPTAYLVGPNDGSFAAGAPIEVSWISDDDLGVASVNLDYSIDGGATWQSIATGLPLAGSFTWVSPMAATTQGQIRVTAYDANALSQFDINDTDLEFGASGGNTAQLIPYGSGKAGSNGMPALTASALPILGTQIQFEINQVRGNSPLYLIFGSAPANDPFDGANVLVDYSTYYSLHSNAIGQATMPGNVPANGAYAGMSFFWQVWVPNDPAAAGAGWACTAGLETVLGY